MSYEKVKYISFDIKASKILITSAPNNISPAVFEKWSFMPESTIFSYKAERLAKHILSGDLKLQNSCNHFELQRLLMEAYNAIPLNLLEEDARYKTRTYDEATDYIAKEIAIPYIYKRQFNLKEIKDYLKYHFTDHCTIVYDKAQRECDMAGEIFIRSAASIDDKFNGYLILLDYNDQAIIAKKQHYTKLGILDNSEKNAIFLPGSGKNAWEVCNFWDKAKILFDYPVLESIA